MRICILGDCHFGARSDHAALHDYFELFYRDQLFPYLKEHGITKIVQLGDLFDRRKYINFATLARAREYFFDPLRDQGFEMDVFVGNHDCFYKNTNDVNSPELLLREYDNIRLFSEPATVSYDGTDVVLLPWVNSGNEEECMEYIRKSTAQILFGHLELIGFEMYRGSINSHGMKAEVFDKFDIVCSGHFHHRSSRGNITYVGTPYEMTWSDFNDPRGFHIFDTETRELTFVQNPYRLFNKIHYDDTNKTEMDILEQDFTEFANTYVKVIVHNKNNPYWFDLFVSKLEKSGVIDMQVVEDHLNLNLEDDADIVEEAEDTLAILRTAVSEVDTGVPRKELNEFLAALYNEAMYVE